MRLTVLSVGRLKTSPEKQLIEDYADRFRKTGRALGFRDLNFIDVESGPTLQAEGDRILSKLPPAGQVLRLDEAGKPYRSQAFADKLAKLRDQGEAQLTFLIGGAAGYSAPVREAYPDMLAFGPQTWPHRLVKVMLAEQLYRAASLLAGSPYHKA